MLAPDRFGFGTSAITGSELTSLANIHPASVVSSGVHHLRLHDRTAILMGHCHGFPGSQLTCVQVGHIKTDAVPGRVTHLGEYLDEVFRESFLPVVAILLVAERQDVQMPQCGR